MPSPEGLVKALKPELNKIFKPAFLGRLVIIPYYPIRDEALKQIIVLKLGKIQRRLWRTTGSTLTYDDALIDEVARRCTEVESGARNVDNILTNTLLPEISRADCWRGWPRAEARADSRRRRRRRRVRLQLDSQGTPSLDHGEDLIERRLVNAEVHAGEPAAAADHAAGRGRVAVCSACQGREAISRAVPLRARSRLAESQTKTLPFDKLLGQKVTLRCCRRQSGQALFQRHRQPGRAECVRTWTTSPTTGWRWCPQLWLLTRKAPEPHLPAGQPCPTS